MRRPANWDLLTPELQEAWRERKRIYERTAPNRVKAKTIERKKVWQQENRDKARTSYLKYSEANREKISANQRKRYNANPKVIEKRLMKKQIQDDPEKIEQRRKRAAELQKIRYYANHEKNLEIKRKWAIQNKNKVLDYQEKHRHRKYRAEIKVKEAELALKPVELDMSKVLAFINKKNGPESSAPITPNMAKVREFIKYA